MAQLFNNDTIGKSTTPSGEEPSGKARKVVERPETLSDEYRQTLQDQHADKSWGGTAVKWAGPDVAKIIGRTERKGKVGRYNIKTALDYGCGQETMKAEFTELEWTGYDPGVIGKDEKPNGKFDLVVCTDVMEHIEREYVETVLQEIADYTKVVTFLEVACTAAHGVFATGPRKGQDVHITQRPPEWWIEKARELKGVHVQSTHALGRQVRGEWRTRVKIILEKL